MDDLTHEQLLLFIAGIAAIITAVSPIIASFGASIGARYTAMRAARREDVEEVKRETQRLNDKIDKIEAENIRLHDANLVLREYVSQLRIVLIDHQILVPPMIGGKNET